jgi:hypothetical protein
MHIELTEMLRCPEQHREEFLVLSTSEMSGRMVYSGLLGCPVCHKSYDIVRGVVEFGAISTHRAPSSEHVDAASLQALLDLSGPGGFVILIGSAARHAEGLAALMSGIHFVGVNAPSDLEELPILSLLRSETAIPLRQAMARAVVVGSEYVAPRWLAEARRILLKGRRLVVEAEELTPPPGTKELAVGQGLWVGEAL